MRLRFSPLVTPRVKESIWHPSQAIADQPDGGCEWSAEIAQWRKMEPWVLGWGRRWRCWPRRNCAKAWPGKCGSSWAAGLYDPPADHVD